MNLNLKGLPNKFLKIIINKEKKIKVIVNGNSMHPILKNSDLISIKKKNKYFVGDIIVFFYKKDNMYLIHRIVFKKRKFIYVKGDNAYRLEKISSKDIIGFVSDRKENKNLLNKYCKIAYKLGKYSKRVKYNMEKIHKNKYYISAIEILKSFT